MLNGHHPTVKEKHVSNKFITVKYDGQEYELEQPSTKHLIFLERQFGIPANSLSENSRLEYVIFLAWAALKGMGLPVGKYGDDFLDKIEIIAEEEDAEAAEEKAFSLEEAVEVPTGAATGQPTDS